MRMLKAHLFVMYDIAVGSPLQKVPEEKLQKLESNSTYPGGTFEKLMDAGSSWMFYDAKTYTDEHGRRQKAKFLYGMHSPVPNDTHTPGSQAKTEDAKTGYKDLGSTRVCLHPDLGLAIVTFWKELIKDGKAGEADGVNALLKVKLQPGEKLNQVRVREALKKWGFREPRIGRITTLLTVQVDTDNLDDFVASNAEDIGRLFTGNSEDERPRRLAAYATDADISRRRFERIYVRSTDALAVYDTTTSLMDMDLASMRVARLVETGILMRRLLRETAFEAEEVMKSIRWWTLPWFTDPPKRAEHLRETVADADLTPSVAPPTHSIEGERLLAQTFAAFDVPKLHKDVRHALSELDRRLEWRRVQWLALFAVLIFIANAAIAVWK
jgi:hypothetical protein